VLKPFLWPEISFRTYYPGIHFFLGMKMHILIRLVWVTRPPNHTPLRKGFLRKCALCKTDIWGTGLPTAHIRKWH